MVYVYVPINGYDDDKSVDVAWQIRSALAALPEKLVTKLRESEKDR